MSFSIKHIAPVLAMMILAGCTSTKKSEAPAQNPHDVKADIVRLMPASAPDKKGWATDITAAFTT